MGAGNAAYAAHTAVAIDSFRESKHDPTCFCPVCVGEAEPPVQKPVEKEIKGRGRRISSAAHQAR